MPDFMLRYPNSHSVLQLDNMPSVWFRFLLFLSLFPQHRVDYEELENFYGTRGIVCAWQPPQSPDMNIIEKFWDLMTTRAAKRHFELLAGQGGIARKLNFADLIDVIHNLRMSRKAYQHCQMGWLA